MEKIKYYGEKGYVNEYEPNDYVVHAMSKALAAQLKEKITHKEAWLLAMSLSAEAYEGEKDLMGGADAYDIVMYFTMKCKIASLGDAWDDMWEKLGDELKIFKADKEQMLIAIAYAACCGFIKDFDIE